MSLTRIPGGLWVPNVPPGGFVNNVPGTTNDGLLTDADQEESQMIGYVYLAGGSGSKTFGTAGSAISWLPGATITFSSDTSNPTYTVGLKTPVDLANGPPARATIGKAAFNVYKDLTGGTDTITSTTWRTDSMASGTPFTVNHGDLICIAFLLTKPGTAAQSVKQRCALNQANPSLPAATLVTSGPTYTAQQVIANATITFDDGTKGWLEGTFAFSAQTSATIGNGNIYGNVFQFPFDCEVDAVSGLMATGGTTNFDVGIWSSPLGTPAALQTVSVDPQVMNFRTFFVPLATPAVISRNTNYVVGVKQNSATSLTMITYDVGATSDLQANGADANTYAALSTAGAAFAQQNSGARRAALWVRVSHVDDGTGRGFPARTFTGF